jgi:hypothetical protein
MTTPPDRAKAGMAMVPVVSPDLIRERLQLVQESPSHYN